METKLGGWRHFLICVIVTIEEDSFIGDEAGFSIGD